MKHGPWKNNIWLVVRIAVAIFGVPTYQCVLEIAVNAFNCTTRTWTFFELFVSQNKLFIHLIFLLVACECRPHALNKMHVAVKVAHFDHMCDRHWP